MSIKISKELIKNRLSVILLLFCCIYMTAITFIGGLKGIDSILFLLFQIFIVFLPGYAVYLITELLEEGKRNKSYIERFGLTYLYGWISNLFLYLLIVPTRIIYRIPGIVIWVLVILLSGFVIIYRHTRKGNSVSETHIIPPEDNNTPKGSRDEIICVLFFVIFLIVEFITYTGNNFIPFRTERSAIFGDVCYWIGNTIELTKGFPPHDFRYYPQPYNYHYLSSMQMALVTLLTDIRPIVAGVFFNTLQVAFLLIFGLYSLLVRLAKGNRKIVVPLQIIFLFSCGIESITYSTNTWHMYIAPFGFDYGLAFLIWGIYFALDFYNNDKVRITQFIKFALMIVITAGVKGPAGLILLAIFGIICIDKVLKKDFRTGIGVGIVLILAFAVAYWKLLNVTGYQRSSKGIIDYILSYANNEVYNNLPGVLGRAYSLINTMTNPLIRVICKSLLVIPFMAFCNPAVFLLGCLSCLIIYKAKENKLLVSLFVLLLYGINWVALCIPVTGLSNRYFSMYAVYLGIIFCAYAMQLREQKKNNYMAMYVLASMGCVLLLFTGYKDALARPLYTGLGTIACNPNINPYSYSENGNYNIKQTQLIGYEQIREMDEGIVVTNMNTVLLGVLSEKYVIKSFSFNKLLNAKKTGRVIMDSCVDELIDNNVNYIVINKELNPGLELENSKLIKNYSDNDFDVYEITG